MNEAKILIAGQPGVGKTVLAGSACRDKRCQPSLLIDCERGTASIESLCNYVDLKTIANPVPDKVNVVRVRSWSDMQKVYDVLVTKCPYKCVSIDTVSEADMYCISASVEGSGISQPLLDKGKADFGDYKTTYTQFSRFLRFFRDLDGVHIIFLAQTYTKLDKESQIEKVLPVLTGRLSTDIRAVVDHVGYYSIVGKDRELSFQHNGRTPNKSRGEGDSNLGKLVNPTMTDILDKLKL